MRALVAALFLLIPAACAPLSKAPAVQRLNNLVLTEDTVWRGSILIDGEVKVAKGVLLTIEPGTDIAFVPKDLNQDGLGDATLSIEGRLRALGTPGQPIRFRSAAAAPQPGDWLEIQANFSKEIHLRYCEIRDSAYTLHAHFTRGIVEDCHIHHNIDGCRLGESTFTWRHNLIENNLGKGINYRNAKVEIRRNLIRRNGAGIFLFESDRTSVVEENNILLNRDNFRLGDFYAADVHLGENWWGSADPEQVAEGIFDRRRDPGIGTVTLTPAPAWIDGTGPRDGLRLRPAWRMMTGGFVDGTAVTAGKEAFIPGWDGRLYALDPRGRLHWRAELGEVADGAAALDGERVYVQTWGREVLALERSSGRVLWRFRYGPSPADDHRQGGLTRIEDLLLVPAWNGTLYALDAVDGALRWQFVTAGPLRATPVAAAGRIYLAAGDGSLSVLNSAGELLWQRRLAAPLLTPPALGPDGLVVVDRTGTLTAFDPAGVELWRRPLGEPCFYGAPVIDGEALFLATAGGALHHLDLATGAPLWRRPLPHPSYGTPSVLGRRVLVGDNGGVLSVVGRDSGDLLADFQAGGAIQSRPVPFGGLLLFGSRDQSIRAIALE